jgi:formylglycine-generating enzyme required for sulfatase activity
MLRLVCALAALAMVAALPALFAGETPSAKEKVLRRFSEELVLLTPGKDNFPASFTMGSDRYGTAAEKPAHKVTFGYSFYVGRYEVTQELYEAIMGNNPSRWKGPRNSVEMVDWDEANDFCRKLTAELRKLKILGADQVIRLPTEAEWEYACRAGTTTDYSFGDDGGKLGDYAWFTGNAKGNDPPVGAKKGNPWGLHDMHGYVWEWCLDAWAENYDKAPDDGSPRKEKDEKQRVVRGGAWTETADKCRSAFRQGEPVVTRTAAIGFRCVRSAKTYQD